jgi:hypothetical protein
VPVPAALWLFGSGLLSLLLIVRGLGLGIPYLSPEYGENNKKNCCTEHIKE